MGPAPGSWTVRRSADGKWQPDWEEPQPDPAPPATIGWLTWHLIWWWSGMLGAMQGRAPVARHAVAWPGSAEATVQRLEALSAEWGGLLSGLDDGDLERPIAHPWPEPRHLSLAIAWANSELMKNVAEIGCIRHLYETSRN
ncbi:MAG: DinB family protein [Rhizomicrobium sp.]